MNKSQAVSSGLSASNSIGNSNLTLFGNHPTKGVEESVVSAVLSAPHKGTPLIGLRRQGDLPIQDLKLRN